MNKRYVVPELEVVRYTFRDVILTSPLEDPIGEVIDPGNGGETPIDLDGGGGL